MSGPGKPWPDAVVDRLSRLSLGREDAPLGELLRGRLGWLEVEARGEDLGAALQDPARVPPGPTRAEVERLRELHEQVSRQAAEPVGRLKQAKSLLLRLLRLYTRPQLDWNAMALEVLDRQDRALAQLLQRVELLERGQRHVEQAQRQRSSDS